MILLRVFVLFAIALISVNSVAGLKTEVFEQGKHYKLIELSENEISNPNKIVVTEFFSYGCPWCSRIESALSTWRVKQPSYVVFNRVPVLFHAEWELYAKAYYTAKMLGLEDKLSPTLFDSILNQKRDLSNNQAMVKFFAEQGIDEKTVASAFGSSISIDSKVAEGVHLMKRYQVFVVPSIVVDGKYRTDLVMFTGDGESLLRVVDYLIKKVNQQKGLKDDGPAANNESKTTKR